MFNKGMLIILSGPSGAGKGTVIKELMKKQRYMLSTSVTTRSKREGEEDGIHYFFESKNKFKNMIKEDKFLEYAEFCGEYYGTPLDYVKEQLEFGKNVILEIEVQGALQVKEKMPDSILIFLTPPSINELEERLTNRNTETPEKIAMRLEKAKEEITMIDNYDYIVVNKVVKKAARQIHNIVRCERKSAKRNLNIKDIFLNGGII